jgi:hypothetical protein
MKQRTSLLVLGLILIAAGAAFGQGAQTGALTGNVIADGQGLPGVLVTATSDKAQGERTAATEANGDYIIRGLPPGTYTVVFSLEGMESVTKTVEVPLGGTARQDAQMAVSVATETVIVTGESPAALETTTTGANFKSETINALPIARNPTAIADLAGGLTNNGPVGNITINGAFAYDNVFLINGVDVTDRYFGTSDNLFIEEAIDEVQVMTSGISAEYGRFSGGVVNAITKSGGNKFEGTFRTDLTRPEWRDETPIEKDLGIERKGDLSKTYSATLGGRIIPDALWFFLGGRQVKADIPRTLPVTQIEVSDSRKIDRYEGKLTWAVNPSHNLQGSYIQNDRTDSLSFQVNPLEPAAISSSSFPNDGWVASYNGTFGSNFFGELRYSEKTFTFDGPGNDSTNPFDSVFRSFGFFPGVEAGSYNAPYFDVTDPEDRSNEQLYGALSYFASTSKMGSHDLKVGVEQFKDIGVGGNSQTSTGFVMFADYLTDDNGEPVFGADGGLQPIWTAGLDFMAFWLPTRGAKNTVQTDSIFVNDRWNLNSHWSFNLGVRYEKNKDDAKGGLSVSSDSIVPRLAASFDPKGDGKWKFDVTYAEYAGKATAGQFGAGSSQGNPSLAYGYYIGPDGLGTNFAPGFDLNNYVFYYFFAPLQTLDLDENLKTPKTREFTVAAGMQLSKGGYLKATYVDRDTTDFIENFIDSNSRLVFPSVGPVTSDLPTEAQRVTNSDLPERKYQAGILEGQYRLTDNWTMGGNWTHQFKNDGNFEGESGQSPQANSPFGDYPEVFTAARSFPSGHLAAYQAEKVRLWTSYLWDFGRGGNLDVGLIGNYDSALTFSYTAASVPLTAAQRAAGANYFSLPSTQTLYFGDRGAGKYNDVWSADVSLQYGIPIFKSFEPYIKLVVSNVTNEDTAATFNTQVSRNTAGPKDAQGLPTEFIKGVNFGKATAAGNYQIPREYFISAGFRF